MDKFALEAFQVTPFLVGKLLEALESSVANDRASAVVALGNVQKGTDKAVKGLIEALGDDAI